MCGTCGGRSLRIVAVVATKVRVEYLTCGKESAIKRTTDSTPTAKPPIQK